MTAWQIRLCSNKPRKIPCMTPLQAGDLVALIVEERFEDAMARLARLRAPIDAFFEKVTVNADDVALRKNRLGLLAQIRTVMNQVADFALIE